MEAVVSDLEADKTIKFVDCSYEIRSRVFCGTGLRIMITISLDIYEKNRKLASFCGSNMDNIFISDKVDILEKIRKWKRVKSWKNRTDEVTGSKAGSLYLSGSGKTVSQK